MSGPPIILDSVRFAWPGGKDMLFSATIRAGTITAVMGPSGSGKSTLLALVAGFEMPLSGHIRFGAADVSALPPWERPLSMVFQDNNVFEHLSVADNVALGLYPAKRRDPAVRAKVDEALGAVGLAGHEARLPSALSGGERQRVALARVLARARPVLLLDEAFASLGPSLRSGMLEQVGDLQRAHRLTVVMVTHDPDDALSIASDLLFVDGGRIAAAGAAADLLGSEAPAVVRSYLGERRTIGT